MTQPEALEAALRLAVGVNPHTLPYYERIGLIRVARDSAGHRRYDAAAVRRPLSLTRMCTSGMSISSQLELALAATEYKLATYEGAPQP